VLSPAAQPQIDNENPCTKKLKGSEPSRDKQKSDVTELVRQAISAFGFKLFLS
jgi:hypothetical protein